MDHPRQNERDRSSDFRKNLFLRGIKIGKKGFSVKAVSRQSRHICLRISADFIRAIRLAMK